MAFFFANQNKLYKGMNSTAVIPTIGRETLADSVASAVREGLDVIVVCDGDVQIPELPDAKIVRLGRKWGCYGSMAYNVGAYMAETEFIVSLADDDELGLGFGLVLENTLRDKPGVDIWIPQLVFNDGDLCCHPSGGHTLGNMCAPIYRASVLGQVPFRLSMGENPHIVDFYHLNDCIREGYILDWQLELKYIVRPQMSKRRGLGRIEHKNKIPMI